MNRLLLSTIGLSLLAFTGCNTGTATAPSTNPQRPEARRELNVTSPGSQVVTQDQTDKMTVSITRNNFDGPVSVELRDLPKGIAVTTQELTIPAGKDSVEVTVKAAADAPPVEDHAVTVSAKAREQKDMKDAVVTFKLTIKAKS